MPVVCGWAALGPGAWAAAGVRCGGFGDGRYTLAMSELATIIERTKAIESKLVRRLGATGRGLHEKVDSVQGKLDPATVRACRFIATIRNKTVHEDGFAPTRTEMKSFVERCDEVERSLGGGLRRRTGLLAVLAWTSAAAGLLFAAVLMVVVRPLRDWLSPPPPVRPLLDDVKVAGIVTVAVIALTIVLAVWIRVRARGRQRRR